MGDDDGISNERRLSRLETKMEGIEETLRGINQRIWAVVGIVMAYVGAQLLSILEVPK